MTPEFRKIVYFAFLDLDIVGHHRATPLIVAASTADLDLVQMILEANPENIDHQDSQGRTSLLWAAYKGADIKVFEELVRHNADCTIKVIYKIVLNFTTKFDRNIHTEQLSSLF